MRSISRSVGGHVSIAGGLKTAIKNTLDIGGTCLQIFAGSPRLWFRKPFDDVQVQEFTSELALHGLQPVFIHALYLVNLASDNPDLVQKSIDSLISDLQNGRLINSAGVVIHIGSHQGRGFDAVQELLIKNLKQIIDSTTETFLLLENDAGQNGKIGSIEELGFLLEALNSPRVGLCLDTAHLFASGYDLRDTQKLELLIAELKKYDLIDKIKLVHLNDSATDLGSGRDNHANLGEGKIGRSGLSNFVNHPALRHLPLILETPGENHAGPNKENIEIAKSL